MSHIVSAASFVSSPIASAVSITFLILSFTGLGSSVVIQCLKGSASHPLILLNGSDRSIRLDRRPMADRNLFLLFMAKEKQYILLLLTLPSPSSPTEPSASSPSLDFGYPDSGDSSPRSREIEPDNSNNHHPTFIPTSSPLHAPLHGRVTSCRLPPPRPPHLTPPRSPIGSLLVLSPGPDPTRYAIGCSTPTSSPATTSLSTSSTSSSFAAPAPTRSTTATSTPPSSSPSSLPSPPPPPPLFPPPSAVAISVNHLVSGQDVKTDRAI